MTSPAIDSFLSLQSAGGTVLRWDDNSCGGFDSFLVQFLPGATYRLAVQASNAISTGYYRLDVLYVAGGRPGGVFRWALSVLEVPSKVLSPLTVARIQTTHSPTFISLRWRTPLRSSYV